MQQRDTRLKIGRTRCSGAPSRPDLKTRLRDIYARYAPFYAWLRKQSEWPALLEQIEAVSKVEA